MSRTSRVLASASLGYVHMVVAMLVGFWFTPFLLRHVGQHDFGLWAVAAPTVSYVSLIDFGVVSLLQREVAFALGAAEGDLQKAKGLSEAVGKTLRLVLYQLPVLCVAGVLVLSFMPASWSDLRYPLAIVLLATMVNFPFRVNHAVLVGLQDTAFLAKLGLAVWLIGTVVNGVVVWLGGGLYGLAISSVAQHAVTITTCYLRVRGRYAIALPKGVPPVSKDEAIAKLTSGFWITISQVAGLLLLASDVVVIAAVRGPDAVTPYTITDKLITILGNTPLFVLASAQPVLSELRTGSSRGRLTEVCSALTLAVLSAGGVIGIVVLAVNGGFIGWWIGPQFFAGSLVTALLVASMVLNHWMSVSSSTLFSFGYEKRSSISTVACGVATLAGTVVFTRLWGLAGAPLASVLALIIVGLPANLKAIARATGASSRDLVFAIVPWAWRFALLGWLAVESARRWPPATLVTLAARCVAAALAYGVFMLPVLRRPPLDVYVRPRVALLWTRVRARFATGS
jgi:O-antigen/teichoic acid export membrane protein